MALLPRALAGMRAGPSAPAMRAPARALASSSRSSAESVADLLSPSAGPSRPSPSASPSSPAPPASPSAPSPSSSSAPPPRFARSTPAAAARPARPRKTGFDRAPASFPAHVPLPSRAGRAPTHVLAVLSTRNNTHLTLSDAAGPLFSTISAGLGKAFKGAARSSYEAAHQAALKMLARVADKRARMRELGDGDMEIVVAYKGLGGQGREAVHAALSGPEGEPVRPLIVGVEDRTPIKIGGTRARRPRRL